MDIKEFIGKFSEIFDDVDVSTLNLNTNFRNLDGWSSLSALGIIAFADEEFNVELNGTELKKMNTIGELYCRLVHE